MRYDYREYRQALANNPDLSADDFDQDALPPAELITSERAMQQAIVDEAQRRSFDNPLWDRLFAIPNELAYGRQPPPGVQAGLPDLFLPVPRVKHGVEYYGLWLELKIRPNKPTPTQEDWHAFLWQQGYMVRVVYDDPAQAIGMIADYLGGVQI